MRKFLHALLVTFLTAGVVLLAVAVTWLAAGTYVLTMSDPADMKPGTIQYETREFWLSIDDIRNGRDESWTAELPDIVKRSH